MKREELIEVPRTFHGHLSPSIALGIRMSKIALDSTDALFTHGTTILGGIRPLQAEKLIHIVAEGGGTPQIMTAAEFTVIRR